MIKIEMRWHLALMCDVRRHQSKEHTKLLLNFRPRHTYLAILSRKLHNYIHVYTSKRISHTRIKGL